MDPWVPPLHHSSLVEAQLVLATFVLCSLIGIERQLRQKSAGFRTHVLVGIGSCTFTLVSVYGFSSVLASSVTLDPSRIAAQIVSGIGFLGAGVIFKGQSMVRGLTTAGTIWVSAAVGMACGAGMLSLAAFLTALHLVTLFVIGPLVRRLPDPDRRRSLRITYADGKGILREVLGVATTLGFTSSILHSRKINTGGDGPQVQLDAKFSGRPPLTELIPAILELPGVARVSSREERNESIDDDAG